MKPGARKRATLAVGVLLGSLAVAFMVKAVTDQWSQVSHAIAHADLGLLVIGFVLAAASMAHLGLLWGDALHLFGHRERRRRVVVWWFVGEMGKYVPGGVLSVVGRAEVARRSGVDRTASYGSVPLSLMLRYFAGMLAFVALVPFDLRHQGSAAGIATVVVAALVPVGLLALHPRSVRWALGRLRRITRRELDLPVPSWGEAVKQVLAYLPNWALIIASTWFTARAFTSDVSLLRVSLATLLSWTIGFLVFPVPAGAGLREAIFGASAGLPTGLAVTVAVASRLLFVLADGLGAAVCFPLLRLRRPPGSPGAPPTDPPVGPPPVEPPPVEPATGGPVR